MKRPSDRRIQWIVLAVAAVVALAIPLLWRHFSGAGSLAAELERYPVRGIDISAHNGDVDFQAVRSAGYSFVIIKASEGSSFKDGSFHSNIWRARKAGLMVGVYHFFRFDATGMMQALNFLHSLNGQHLDLPVCIDVEQWTNPTDRTTSRVLHTLDFLIRRLERQGHKVMIYTNKDGYADFVARRFSDYPLWISSFTPLPASINWTIWQYSHAGSVPGVKGNVDLNVFRGTTEQFRSFTQYYRTCLR